MDEGEDGVVLAKSVNGIADEGDVAAAWAREGSVGAGGEHFGETLFAEAMPTLKQKRDSLLLVVPRLANRTTRHLHFSSSSSSSSSSSFLDFVKNPIEEEEKGTSFRRWN